MGHRQSIATVRYTAADAARLAEEVTRQREQLHVMGQLAARVAHDFNNVLALVGADAEMLQDRLGQPAEAQEFITEILGAVSRGSALTRQLLAFSRRDAGPARLVDVRRFLGNSRALLQRLTGEGIAIHIEAGDGPTTVMIDPTQLEVALMNLAANARDAMADGGRLTIRSEAVTLGPTRERPAVRSGRYVRISVTDGGAAMAGSMTEPWSSPPRAADRLRPAGLGLAMVRGVAGRFGGHVSVTSVAGRGTTLTLDLPCAKAAPTS
jgi:signal transduction histidine kinase